MRLQRAEAVLADELSQLEEQARSATAALAEKDRDVQQLKRRLEERPRAPAVETVEAVTISPADIDRAARKERERLQQLQDEWREKLRQAEVDLSIKRAKLARQRVEIEERIRSAPVNLPQTPATAPATAPAAADAPQSVSGHWLAKLGLTEADRVRRRKR